MKKNGHKFRLSCIAIFFIFILGVLIWRMYDLTITDRKFLLRQGAARSLRVINIPAHRGMIIDREGAPIAVSTQVQSAWANPKIFSADDNQLSKLAKLIGISKKQLVARIKASKEKEFVYLRRQLPPNLVSRIAALKIPGVYFQDEFKRYYPEGDSIAQLIGFTNIDDNGIEGLELAYQNWLMGVSGKKRVVKDRLGRIVEELDVIKQPRPGNILQLSIDRRIQFFAYHELKNTIEKFGAKAGSVIVLDSTNGEILAVANYPSFNPNIRSKYNLDSYRNKALTDTFEPGSVIKALSVASALESGRFQPNTIINTEPSYMMVNGHMIRDIHNYGILDVVGVLQRSSNIGISKMVLANPPDQLINLFMRFGLGQRTESGYPGESEGSIVKVADANPFVLATLGFGYGLTVTAMQLAKAYSVFANQGKLLSINFLRTDEARDSKQVLKAKTADQVLSMLEAVVKGDKGTGNLAKVPGYRVAGKTGTARIAGKNGYDEHRHIASFVGIAPVTRPRLIVVVVIHEPTKNGYYAAGVAAPLFAKVMSAALRILDITPDEPSSLT